MSVARGILNYLDKADAIQAVEKKKQDEREALAFELEMKYGSNFLTSSKKGKDTGTSSSTAVAALMKTYNISEEALAPILATGDRTAAPRLLSMLEKQRLKYENQKLILPEDVISEIVESAVLTQPSTRDIDFSKLENFIGREMDSLYKDLLKSQSKDPGAVFFPEPAFVEKPSLEDLDRFEKRAISGNLTRAQDELDMVKNKIAEFDSLDEGGNLTTDQIAERSWLVDRKVEIETAVKSYNDDNVVPIAGLYGTAYTKTLQQLYPRYEDAYINPALLNASSKEITVPNRAVAESLAAAGILKAGDVVINAQTGNPIPIQ
tara:strand:+ start:513 stop:1472 length:960 start_codon:yes stop_codon:yes gene_type:complete